MNAGHADDPGYAELLTITERWLSHKKNPVII
jgi:hypothetical protein